MFKKILFTALVLSSFSFQAQSAFCGKEAEKAQKKCFKKASQKLLSSAYKAGCFEELTREEVKEFKSFITVNSMDCLSSHLVELNYKINLECPDFLSIDKNLTFENGLCR